MNVNSVFHPSVVPLDGGNNFRDLGGNRGAENRRIKSRLLFRSGSLDKLSEKDSAFLNEYAVVNIIDYRDIDEAQCNPDILWPDVHYHHVPANPFKSTIYGNLKKLTTADWSTFNAPNYMLELYRHLPFNNLAYQQLVKLLQDPGNGGIIQHCTLGKDRTGIGSALVLFALGADESTVIEDYLLTEITLIPFREQMLAQLALQLNDQVLNQLTYMLYAIC